MSSGKQKVSLRTFIIYSMKFNKRDYCQSTIANVGIILVIITPLVCMHGIYYAYYNLCSMVEAGVH